MKKFVILLVISCLSLAAYSQVADKAMSDNEFEQASGITATPLDSAKINSLTHLGMLWGFIKYHHAAVKDGNFNMDAELFRVLPKVLAANDVGEANGVMEQWVDAFGQPAPCKGCTDFKKTPVTKLMPDYGYLFDKNLFTPSFADKLSYIKKNRSLNKAHYYVAMEDGLGYPVFKHESSYTQNVYPDAGLRLLALYRYWNMVQYFYPNRHLIDEDWSKVLIEFIPEFWNAKDAREYQLACLKLVTRIHDTHANVWRGSVELEAMIGTQMPPIEAAFVGGKLVVVAYTQDTLDITYKVKPGDIIEMIDDVPVADLVKKYLPLTSASNYETQLRDLPGPNGFLFRGSKNEVDVTISRDGKLSVFTLPRIPLQQIRTKNSTFGIADTAYKIISGNIGYIYPGLLKGNEIDSIKKMFAGTRGTIIDMRCIPASFMPYKYGDWLKASSTPFVRYSMGNTDIPGLFVMGDKMTNGGNATSTYKGKVVVIVNAETQSQGEYAAMAISSAPGVVVIGSTTAGAAGNVSDITLPGGIRTGFTGVGILYPDGTETQRKGLKINTVVKPTIKGIAENRDELLDEAIHIINSSPAGGKKPVGKK